MEGDSNDLPEIGFIKLTKVLRHIPVSKSAWFNGIKNGRYPKQIKLGPRSSAWDVVAIRKLIEDLRTVEKSGHDGRPS